MRLRHRLPPQSRLMQSIPSWVDPDALLAMQFGPGRYWRSGAGLLPATSVLATTRSSGINLPDAAGVIQSLGNNTLPRTSRGLYANGQIAALNQNGNNPQVATGWGGVGASISNGPTIDGLFQSAYVLSIDSTAARRTATSIATVSGEPIGIKLRYGTGQNDSGEVYARFTNSVISGPRGAATVTSTSSGALTIVRQTATEMWVVWEPNATSSAGFVGLGPNVAGKDIRLDGIDITETPFAPDAWVSTSSPAPTLLASDIRAVQGVRPSDSQAEPFAGWEAAGLDNAFGILASVKIDRLNAASARTIAAVGIDANQLYHVYLDTDNRVKARLRKLGAELVSNPGGPFVDTTGWTEQQGTMSVVGGKLRATRAGGTNGRATTPITCVVGRPYRVNVSGIAATATGAIVIANSTGSTAGAPLAMTSDGTYTFVATQTTHYVMALASAGADGTYVEFSSVSVREIIDHYTLQSGTISTLGNYDIAAILKPGANSLTVSGVAGDTNASVETLPAGATTLRIGSDFGVINPFNGWIKELQILKVAA